MKRTIKKVLLIVNTKKSDAEALAETTRRFLEERGIEGILFRYSGKPAQPTVSDVDMAISLGGDGTVLFGSRILSSNEVPIMPVNVGDFGFIAEIGRDEIQEAFQAFEAGDLGVSRRIMVGVEVLRDGKEIVSLTGLNDVVISSSGISKLVRLKLQLSNAVVGGYRADGVILATPTGSTAYSLAAGGPILHPEMDAFILAPICPFSLSNRPLVVPGTEVVALEIESNQRTAVTLTVDGQFDFPLNEGDEIVIRKAAQTAHIVRSNKRSFYDVLRSKLNWSGVPDGIQK